MFCNLEALLNGHDHFLCQQLEWKGFILLQGLQFFKLCISLVDVIEEPASEYNFNLMASGKILDSMMVWGVIKSGLTPEYSVVIGCRFLVLNFRPESK